MSDLVIRNAEAADREQIIRLLAASLGRDDDERFVRLFAWKHDENVFGASPAWVADDGGVLAAIRVFMRWEFREGSRIRRAVRAVDTATHPDYQGRGLFTRLTRHGLEAMAAEGVEFVFNTPNDQSRPGYLKMGWHTVGRLPVAVRPRSVPAVLRMARARVPAERWSLPSTAGDAAAEVFADSAPVTAALGALGVSARLQTSRSAAFFLWRYGTDLLHYRVVAAPGGVERGFVVFRVRRRGEATEAAIGDIVVPDRSRRTARVLLRAVRPAR
jgi:GNAT superfamily N-acetyltransferase